MAQGGTPAVRGTGAAGSPAVSGGSSGSSVSAGAGGGGSGGSGSGQGGSSAGSSGAAGSRSCSDITSFDECEARSDCHSVFEDPRTCSCALLGCCTHFARCAEGDKADCEGRSVSCDIVTPYCEAPAYVVSAAGSCYEGCVDPKDCAPACTAPEDPSGCACYSDADCTAGLRCYSADCASETPGSCRPPPADGCFGDVDCPTGETCIGGYAAPCHTAIADGIGTCGVEACPEGDCSAIGPECTCSDGAACVAATGPTGSGLCRGGDGTCIGCACAAPDTPVATPSGERAIAELRPGDHVYSVDGDGIVTVPILRVNRTLVYDHRVLHITFDNGRSIHMTAGHPLPDGRPLSTLEPGSTLLGGMVVSVVSVPYAYDATYDILPDSPSGAYFASDVLVGSTLTRTHLCETAACATRTDR
jgi:hypothetical protein